MRICFVTTGLGTGGAETMLVAMARQLVASGHECSIISLGTDGTMSGQLREAGATVLSLGTTGVFSLPASLGRLIRAIRAFRPDVVQGWMYHGNFAASMACALGADRPVVWAVHQSLYDIALEKRLTRLVIRWCARLSKKTGAVVYVSSVSATQHRKIGFEPAVEKVIPNGFDIGRYEHAPDSRSIVRAELGLPADAFVIGNVARWHPMKDHVTLLRGFADASARAAKLWLVCVGAGVDGSNPSIQDEVIANDIGHRVLLLGERRDVPRLLSAFDVLCVSSAWGEAFPMVVGEAMASKVPCVVTNIGDAPMMVDDCGLVIPPASPSRLADALLALGSLGEDEFRRLGERASARVGANYSIQAVVGQYLALYDDAMRRHEQHRSKS